MCKSIERLPHCVPIVASLLVLATVLAPERSRAAADLDVLAAPAAKYESGGSAESLRQFEQRLREAIGDPHARVELEAALIRLLAPDTTFEAKRFACTHLAVYGSDASLPALGALLKQDETAGIACFALGGMRSTKVGELLRATLSEAKGSVRLQIVSTLGHRAETESIKPLSSLTRDTDTGVANAAIRALGFIDAASARDAVAALRREASPAVAAAVAEASLCGVQQLVASGDMAAASAVCGELVKPAYPAHIRRGAFGQLLRCDADGGVQRIRILLNATPPDTVLSAAAIARLSELRGEGVSKMFGEVVPRLPPLEQVLLIEALACRADPDARAVIRAQVGAANPSVRRAAIAAVGKLEDASTVVLLSQALSVAATPEEAKYIQLALAGLQGGDKTDQALCDALRQATGKDKPPLMTVLSKRGGAAAVATLLEHACGADEAVARAAAQALTRLADSGDEASLAALQTVIAGKDARVRQAALRALVAWRGVAAWDTLASLYLKPESVEQHALALRGLIRIAGEGNAHPDAALLGRYRQLLVGARGDEDRRQILRVLAGVGHPDALALALPLLDVPGVRAEAEQSIERIANAIKATYPDLSGDAMRKLIIASSRGGAAEPFIDKSDLFEAGKGGYALYHIPGIMVTAKGSVLAWCEARKRGSDWDMIDILLRRSTDNGRTFDLPKCIAEVKGPITKNPFALRVKDVNTNDVTYNNPVLIPDRDGSVHGLFCVEYMRCFYMRSADDGVTWGASVEITAVFEKFRTAYDWRVLATGPDHGIQLKSGRLVVPVWLSTGTGGNAHRPSVTATIFSDDGGATWQVGEIAVPCTETWINPNEAVAVELGDGRVMLNVRNESKTHRRLVTVSPDGATGWSMPRFDEALLEPICMGSIVRYPAKPDRSPVCLLFSNPNNLSRSDGKEAPGKNRDRKNLSVKLSRDNGQTWPVSRTVESGPSMYSDLAVALDGTIFCFYGCAKNNGFAGDRLTLARFNLEWLTGGVELTK